MAARVRLFGVEIDSLRKDEMLARIARAVSEQERLLVAHVNIRGMNLAYEQPWLRDFYKQADLVYCDGMGVMLGARLVGGRIKERYTLADWVWPLAEMAANEHIRLFLLGDLPGIAESAARRLKECYPDLQVVGCQHGFFDKSPGSSENEVLIKRLNALRPDLMLVGLGMPLQERWLHQNWLRLNVRVAITCGALFEYLSGDLKRGPQWMTDHYLEWLARMIISPRRYAGRYLRDIPLFYFRVLKQVMVPKKE